MKVAYVSYKDARDVRSWSGTEYHMARSLIDAGAEVEYLGPAKRPFTPINFARYLFNHKVLGKVDHPQRDPRFVRLVAKQFEAKLARSDAKAVLGHGVIGQAYLNAGRPMAVWTDATFANIIDYYPNFKNLSARSIRDGHATEKDMLDRCDLVIFSCQWAIDSAIRDYGCDPKKLRLLSFGANVPDTRTVEDIERLVAGKVKSPVRLLHMGVHWQRKGADTAVAVAKELNARGVKVELNIAGCTPGEGETVPEYVKLLGFISKSTPEGVARIEKLFEEAHFFIVPSRADCTPIVFCEAASFGLPVLTRDTGGIASVVTNGVNGMCFPDGASPKDYADMIQRTLETPGEYRRLALSSFNEYKTRLNWGVAGRNLRRMMEEMVASKGGRP
jgi:glycosyltransferase involved in cell wall biosynthesis